MLNDEQKAYLEQVAKEKAEKAEEEGDKGPKVPELITCRCHTDSNSFLTVWRPIQPVYESLSCTVTLLLLLAQRRPNLPLQQCLPPGLCCAQHSLRRSTSG